MNIVEIEPDFLNIESIQLPEFKISEPYEDRIEELSSTRKSANFGGGIELLMNEKNKGDKKSSNENGEDLSINLSKIDTILINENYDDEYDFQPYTSKPDSIDTDDENENDGGGTEKGEPQGTEHNLKSCPSEIVIPDAMPARSSGHHQPTRT